MPGRGEAAKILAAVVLPKFTNIEGLAVKPVPPFLMDKVPVTPGLGLVAKTFAASLLSKSISIEGLEVKPVPPLPMGRMPVTPGLTAAVPSKLTAEVDAKFI
jgi:hypothetical protein